MLFQVLGEDVFKRAKNDKFTGGTLLSSFESIVPGVYQNLDHWEQNQEILKEKIISIYSNQAYDNAMRKGTRALDRMLQLIKFSREMFFNEN